MGEGRTTRGRMGQLGLSLGTRPIVARMKDFGRAIMRHPSYIGAAGFDASQFDGSEFWLQFRIKIDSNRYLSGTPSEGKQSFLATTQQTLNQEIVQMNREKQAGELVHELRLVA